MYEEILRLIHSVPFQPFAVCLTDQRKFPVPTRDHVLLTKKATLHVQNDEGLVDIISLRNVASVQLMEESAAA